MVSLEKWVGAVPKPKPRPATLEDIEPLYNTFQRVRKLKGLKEKFTNVWVWWPTEANAPKHPDEWALVIDVYEAHGRFNIVAVPLGTTDKAKAVRRAYGWGLKDKDGNPKWPPAPDEPLPDEPHIPDVDEAAYFHYWRF